MRDFKTSYAFNGQYDGATTFFVIVKMVNHDTCTGLSDIKTNMDTRDMSQFKHDIHKTNIQIAECINYIYIAG